MNGENLHHTGYAFRTPDRDSKGWARIIARGCGGVQYETDCGTEYDCSWGYGCPCEECPIGIESMEREHTKWENEHQGPPCPIELRTPGRIWFATVGAEL